MATDLCAHGLVRTLPIVRTLHMLLNVYVFTAIGADIYYVIRKKYIYASIQLKIVLVQR